VAAPVNREKFFTQVSAPDRPGNQRLVKNKAVTAQFGVTAWTERIDFPKV
jgi:hypothetical protein